MQKIEPTSLGQFPVLIWKLPTQDLEGLSEMVDKEIINRRNEKAGVISSERAIEVLRIFHDNFYEEYKEGCSQNELRNALRWVLTNYGETKSDGDSASTK